MALRGVFKVFEPLEFLVQEESNSVVMMNEIMSTKALGTVAHTEFRINKSIHVNVIIKCPVFLSKKKKKNGIAGHV